ncbi:hypothetical protein TEA_005327 [Camellia sinensis var. sinensis]|uniref:Uncharacterized protein n=1 Tax=Camellia sinensis var. sinensis TaxID=542762 RepID=A0A4S4EPI9_CAMSN|nr:hypothetical protein TEA_005327 [Camellia sinensis var. sinensis]
MKVPKKWLGIEPFRTALVSLEPHLHAKKLPKESAKILLSTSFLVPVEAAASAVMEVVSKGGTTFYGGFMDKISASNSLEQIHGTLNDTVKRLLAKRDNCQNRLQRHKNKMPTNTCNNWVCRVLKIEEDVKDFESKFEKENKGSRVWHVLSRSEFYQEMKDKWERVLKLLEESNQLGEYLVDQPPNLNSSVGRVWKAHYNQGGLVGFAIHCLSVRSNFSLTNIFYLGVFVTLRWFSPRVYIHHHVKPLA